MSTQMPQGGQPQPGAGWTPPPAGGYQQPGAGYPPPFPGGAGGYGGPPPVPGVPPLPAGVVLAPVGRRIGAFFLAIPLALVTLYIGYIIWGAIVWGRGTSPALGILKMRCVKADTGQKAGWGTMLLRDFIGGIVQGILSIITLLISFFMFLSRADHRSLCDLVGGTVVVYDPQGVMGK